MALAELSPSAVAPELSSAVAPRFTALLTDSHVTEGDPATLHAAVTGTPKPTISWFRDGIPLIPNAQLQISESPDGNSTVSIPYTTVDLTGQYEVVATNFVGTAKCAAYLSIGTKLPTPPTPAPREHSSFTKLATDTQVVNGNSAVSEAEVMGQHVPSVSVSPSLNGFNGSHHVLVLCNQNTCQIVKNTEDKDNCNNKGTSVSVVKGKAICNKKETTLSEGIQKCYISCCDNDEKDKCNNNETKVIDKIATHKTNFCNLKETADSGCNSTRPIHLCNGNNSNSDISIMAKDEYSVFMANLLGKENTKSKNPRTSTPNYNLYVNHESLNDGFDSGAGESCDTSCRKCLNSQVSSFQDLDILGLDAYSQFLKNNKKKFDVKSSEESFDKEEGKEELNSNGSIITKQILGEHPSYTSLDDMKNAALLNSNKQQKANNKTLTFVEPGEYSSMVASNFETEVVRMEEEDTIKPLSVDVSFQNDSGEISCIGSPIEQQEPIRFLDTGIAQDLKLFKLCDLWSIIKHNISKDSDEYKYNNTKEKSDQMEGSDKIKNRSEDLQVNDLSLETGKLKATDTSNYDTQNQYKPSDDSNLASWKTLEDIVDSVEMESGYYSGDFLSFSSITDEQSNTSDLGPRNEIQSNIDTQSNQFSLAISNRSQMQSNIDYQNSNFSSIMTNNFVEEIPIVNSDSDTCILEDSEKYKAESSYSIPNHHNFHTLDQPITEMLESQTENYHNQMLEEQCNDSCKEYKTYFSDDEASGTFDCESQTFRTFHEDYELHESQQPFLLGAVRGTISKHHHSSLHSGETRQRESMWSTGYTATGHYMGVFDAIPAYPSLRPSSDLSDISEEDSYHAIYEESNTTLECNSTIECYNASGNNDVKPSSYDSSHKDSNRWSYGIAVYGVPSEAGSEKEEFEQMEREILGTSNEYPYSPAKSANYIKQKACNVEHGNEEVQTPEYVKLNDFRSQMNVTKDTSVQPQMTCITNGDIKSTHSKRNGTKNLESLQRLTMMLKQPSKLSLQNKERKNIEVLNNNQKIQKMILQSCSDMIESSRISFNYGIPGNNAEDLFEEGIFYFVIKASENLSLSQLHVLIKEKILNILKAGYSLIRKYALPVSNETENKAPTESLFVRVLQTVNKENLEQFAFDICLLATRGQDAMLGGESIDYTTPGLLQVGYYLIYVVLFREDS